jgi:hypothetical protein
MSQICAIRFNNRQMRGQPACLLSRAGRATLAGRAGSGDGIDCPGEKDHLLASSHDRIESPAWFVTKELQNEANCGTT